MKKNMMLIFLEIERTFVFFIHDNYAWITNCLNEINIAKICALKRCDKISLNFSYE